MSGSGTIEVAAGPPTLVQSPNALPIVFGTASFGSLWLKDAATGVNGAIVGMNGTISNFAAGDTIDLVQMKYYQQQYNGQPPVPESRSVSYAGGMATITNADGSVAAQFQISGGFSQLALAPDGLNTQLREDGTLLVACYAAGTRIATPAGLCPIEHLAPGDMVLTALGLARPIRWIGRRAYDRRFAAANPAVWPVRITAGALADGVPARDLLVSARHAMLVDGVLVPAAALANGVSIHRDETPEVVDYLHIELESHDVVLAEGAASETFSDCDNRWMFHNAATAPASAAPRWHFCAPRLEEGGVVDAMRRRFARRARAQHPAAVDAAGLHLLADGTQVLPECLTDGSFLFRLAAVPSELRLRSRKAAPTGYGSRPRGVAVHCVKFAAFGCEWRFDAADPAFSHGFHAAETRTLRWTDGDGALPIGWLAGSPGPITITLEASLPPAVAALREDVA